MQRPGHRRAPRALRIGTRGMLRGGPLPAASGHVRVLRGSTAGGDVVVNDPAAARTRGVRRLYDRGRLEDAWLSGSGGRAYVAAARGTRHAAALRPTNPRVRRGGTGCTGQARAMKIRSSQPVAPPG